MLFVMFTGVSCGCPSDPCLLLSFKNTSSNDWQLYLDSNTRGDSSANNLPLLIKPIYRNQKNTFDQYTVCWLTDATKYHNRYNRVAYDLSTMNNYYYRVSLSGFFDVMRSDDDGLVSIFRELNQMFPNADKKKKKNTTILWKRVNNGTRNYCKKNMFFFTFDVTMDLHQPWVRLRLKVLGRA